MEDHPRRNELANEMHARPFPSLAVPTTASYLAIMRTGDAAGRNKTGDIAHLIALLDRHGAPHPPPGATHYFGAIGTYFLKWESHTEFVTYTAFCENLGDRAFDPADFDVFPKDWLADMPGERISSATIRVEPWVDEAAINAHLNTWFVAESLAVARVLDGAAVMAGDFRVHPDGHLRFALFVGPTVGPRRVGRTVQRLCEIETYKAISMLGFGEARDLSPRLATIGAQVAALVGDMSNADRTAEDTLQALLKVSAELEQMSVQSSFRFGATAAYEAIVHERVEVLREQRFEGRQIFHEFMMRRYDPAMRTVKATERRLKEMADRAMRAGELLRTRVDVERSAQNQALLESMDRRADAQLRLQRTVEGLSVVAISYYAINLVVYAGYPLAKIAGFGKPELSAIATPVVALVVWLVVRNIRNKH